MDPKDIEGQSIPIEENLSILGGLYHIVDKSESTDLLTGLYNQTFNDWIAELSKDKTDNHKGGHGARNKKEADGVKYKINKWRIGLLSISLRGSEENVLKFREQKQMLNNIISYFEKCKSFDETYIYLLRIMEYTANQGTDVSDKELAMKYRKSYVHESLIENIKDKLATYKKFNSLSESAEDSSAKSQEVKQLEFRILSAEIDCLSSILKDDMTKEEKEILKRDVHDNILSILSHSQADPMLLISCCRYTKHYLSLRDVKYSTEIIKTKLTKLDNCIKLLPYLGESSFEVALKQCEQYLNLESTSVIKKDRFNLKDQHNTMMNDLLIAIINVIELICKEAVGPRNKTRQYFKNISDALNNADREKYLFKCFDIPDDEVRLALVYCILQVPLKELDIEEINYLMKAISESKNIGAGKAEEIISTIFLIFIKLVKDQENSASKNFRLKYGRSAIDSCLEIMFKNQKRSIEEKDEALEKRMLSVSCLFFLKEASKAHEMSSFMEEQEFSHYFFENLLAEQTFTFREHDNVPIELEYTSLGGSFYNMRETLFGAKALNPWNKVSFRVIQQIGNVLQNLDPLSVNPFVDETHDKTSDAMVQNLENGFVLRLKDELGLWYEHRDNEFETLLNQEKPFNSRVVFQHREFAINSGLYLLTTFLTRKNLKIDMDSRNEGMENFSIYSDEDMHKNPLLKEELYQQL